MLGTIDDNTQVYELGKELAILNALKSPFSGIISNILGIHRLVDPFIS